MAMFRFVCFRFLILFETSDADVQIFQFEMPPCVAGGRQELELSWLELSGLGGMHEIDLHTRVYVASSCMLA